MMLSIESLKALGANTEEGLSRCLGKEEFYFKLIRMAMEDHNFDRLEQSLKEQDLTAAFEAAHALKGVAGNLALAPLFDALSEITEPLRAKEEADYPALLQAVQEQKDAFRALCEE